MIERPKPKQPRPEHAERVFQGVLYDVYQWDQEMFDGTTARFETLKRADTVVVIPITEQGMVVIQEQEQPGKMVFTSFPGGRVEPGEDPEVAAARELKEETGYEAQRMELWYSDQPVTKIDWAIYVFFARGCKKTAEQSLDAGEKIVTREVEVEEVFREARAGKFWGDITERVLRAELEPEQMAQLVRLFGKGD